MFGIRGPALPSIATRSNLPEPSNAAKSISTHELGDLELTNQKVTSTLTSGHAISGDSHLGLPCNWWRYWSNESHTPLGAPKEADRNNEDSVGGKKALRREHVSHAEHSNITPIPTDDIEDAAHNIIDAFSYARDAHRAQQGLSILKDLKLPSQDNVSKIMVEQVVKGEGGNKLLETITTEGMPKEVVRAYASEIFSQLRTLVRVKTEQLSRNITDSRWNAINAVLLGMVAVSASILAIGTVAGLAATGPIGCLALAFGVVCTISVACHEAWRQNRALLISEMDKENLLDLQNVVDAEVRDHASEGHRVVGITLGNEGVAQRQVTPAYLASRILSPRAGLNGRELFDAARQFASRGYHMLAKKKYVEKSSPNI